MDRSREASFCGPSTPTSSSPSSSRQPSPDARTRRYQSRPHPDRLTTLARTKPASTQPQELRSPPLFHRRPATPRVPTRTRGHSNQAPTPIPRPARAAPAGSRPIPRQRRPHQDPPPPALHRARAGHPTKAPASSLLSPSTELSLQWRDPPAMTCAQSSSASSPRAADMRLACISAKPRCSTWATP